MKSPVLTCLKKFSNIHELFESSLVTAKLERNIPDLPCNMTMKWPDSWIVCNVLDDKI